jgi:hypothetical protein
MPRDGTKWTSTPTIYRPRRFAASEEGDPRRLNEAAAELTPTKALGTGSSGVERLNKGAMANLPFTLKSIENKSLRGEKHATRLPLSLTPKGKSTLNPPPPWHYSADLLSIEFWADPAAVRAILPEGLDPDPADGHANGCFYDWQFSGSNEEFLDPARYQYREFFILLDTLFEGRRVSYCPYIFVDNDAARARGWSQGYPKRLGSISQTRYYAATGEAAGPALAAGWKFAGTLSAGGQRPAEGDVTLREPVKVLSTLHPRPVLGLVHWPRLAAGVHDKPAIHELVENVPHDVNIEQAWAGEGNLALPVCKGEELSDRAPHRCDNGVRASMAYGVDDLKTLKRLTAEQLTRA